MASLQPKLSSLSLSSSSVENASPLGNSDTNQISYRSKRSMTSYERKFNLVVYGLSESPEGTSKHTRLLNDLQKAVSTLSSIDSDNSVCDCFRLGKYSVDHC